VTGAAQNVLIRVRVGY